MEYEIVIGLEVHAELSTETKIFCGCTTAFGGAPNTHCCPVCTGMPGTLPVLNGQAVDNAVKAGLALNCSISRFSKMDRKNYFYPDLPKAYQISQYDLPLCRAGWLDIETEAGGKRIRIHRIHLEEDAGKLLHDQWDSGSLVDYNRCGVPLIEIVTEPDLRSAEEAKAFLEALKTILEYSRVSDCKMQEGSLRCDVNLSVRPKGSEKLGTRTEMKNLNSFRAVHRAIAYEAARQISVLEEGGAIVQETRRWDDDKGVSLSMRSKEEAQDYRYFPDPDLVPIVLTGDHIERMRSMLPEMPQDKRRRYREEYGLPAYDAALITSSIHLAALFEETVALGGHPKTVSNWLMGDVLRLIKDRGVEWDALRISGKDVKELMGLVADETVSISTAKTIFEEMFDTGKSPAIIVKEKGLRQISDADALTAVIEKVLDGNPRSVQDYRAGKVKAIGFLVGQAMRETRGKANPQMVNGLLEEALKKRL